MYQGILRALSMAVLAALWLVQAPYAEAATTPTGFNYPTPATWTGNGNWLSTGCDGYTSGYYHIGEDISGAKDTKVYAIAPGRVIETKNTGDVVNSMWIWVEHDLADGSHFYALYAHVVPGKTAGTAVVRGDEIAAIADYPPAGSTSGDHLHFGIRPNGILTSGWGRGALPSNWDCSNQDKSQLDARGFVAPWDYLQSHTPSGMCTPASVSWTSLPSQVWYRTDQRLAYSVGGTSPTIQEDPSDGSTGDMYLSQKPAGANHYHVHVTNDCNADGSDIDWVGYWDNIAPTAARSGGASPNTWYRIPQVVTWGCSDSNSGVRRHWYRWNGGGWVVGSGNAGLAEGTNTLEVLVEDNAYNGDAGQSGNTATVNLGQYRLDTISPSISLTGPATSAWFKTSQQLTWSASDATSGVAAKTLTWDTGAQTTASPAAIPEGKRTATVAAADVAGNSASQSFGPWWIDTTPPIASAIFTPAQPNGQDGWYITNPTMAVTAADPNGSDASGVNGRLYSIDGSPEAPFTAPVLISGDGIHTYSLRATDVAGNSGTSGDQAVKVDTTAPVFDSLYTDTESGSLSTLVATWSCSDPDSGVEEYEYWIGTTPGEDDIKSVTSAGANNWAYVVNLNLTPGQNYYFSVTARNMAGVWTDVVISNAILAVQGQYDASPNMNAGGVSVPEEARTSTNYKIVDSVGQFVVSRSESPNFVMEHGYWHSDLTMTQAASPGAAKAIENGRTLWIGTQDKPVIVISGTSTFADRFYVESSDHSSGIACQYGAAGGPTLIEGDQVTLIGKINTVNGERMIQFASPTMLGHVDPLAPLFMAAPKLGGEALNQWTPGVLDGVGLNNVGLLIQTYGGLVSYRDPQGNFFYVDNGDGLYDGSRYGVRVVCDGLAGGAKLAVPAYGKTIIVTGISSVVMISDQPVRAIRPRRQSDIVEIR